MTGRHYKRTDLQPDVLPFPGVIGPFFEKKLSMACISRRLRNTGTGPFVRVRLKNPGLKKPRKNVLFIRAVPVLHLLLFICAKYTIIYVNS